MKRSGWVGDISTLDDHPLENGHVLRGALIQDTLITAICQNKTRIGVSIAQWKHTSSRFHGTEVKLLTTEKRLRLVVLKRVIKTELSTNKWRKRVLAMEK